MADEKPVVYGKVPRRFRFPVEKHPNGSEAKWFYGCYFPQTDLIVAEMGGRGTGMPTEKSNPGLEWLDEPATEWRPAPPPEAVTPELEAKRQEVARRRAVARVTDGESSTNIQAEFHELTYYGVKGTRDWPESELDSYLAEYDDEGQAIDEEDDDARTDS